MSSCKNCGISPSYSGGYTLGSQLQGYQASMIERTGYCSVECQNNAGTEQNSEPVVYIKCVGCNKSYPDTNIDTIKHHYYGHVFKCSCGTTFTRIQGILTSI